MALPVTQPNLPNGNVSTDIQTGITPNQYAVAPGESFDAYQSRIAGLRSAAGMPSGDGSSAPSAEDQVAQSLGYKSYGDAVSTLTAPPSDTETDLYNKAYSAAGLDGIASTIAGKKNSLAQAQNNINDNPWLDEASRVGRNNTVQTLADADIKNDQDEYDSKLKEVEDLVTREGLDQTNTSDANKAKLAALEDQAKTLAAQQQTAAEDANKAPTTIKGATGATYQWNPTSGKFDQILPGKPTSNGNTDTIQTTDNNGKSVTVPVDVAPYYNTSSSGIGYVDASSLEGTAAEKKAIVDEATKAGLQVITNKNTAADLVNIQDANSKLDTISSIMAGIDQPGVLSRALYGAGLSWLATKTESNPEQAAAGALQSVGLDILKAISGVQGFRGNATVIQQINDHLPSIYDTDAVVQQKVSFIKDLISDRENSILGKPPASGVDTYNGITLPNSSNSGSTYNGITLPN